jgi:hypothetical protein
VGRVNDGQKPTGAAIVENPLPSVNVNFQLPKNVTEGSL